MINPATPAAEAAGCGATITRTVEGADAAAEGATVEVSGIGTVESETGSGEVDVVGAGVTVVDVDGVAVAECAGAARSSATARFAVPAGQDTAFAVQRGVGLGFW
jgi:hypothetical protein